MLVNNDFKWDICRVALVSHIIYELHSQSKYGMLNIRQQSQIYHFSFEYALFWRQKAQINRFKYLSLQ